jgi:hypothetical protein
MVDDKCDICLRPYFKTWTEKIPNECGRPREIERSNKGECCNCTPSERAIWEKLKEIDMKCQDILDGKSSLSQGFTFRLEPRGEDK